MLIKEYLLSKAKEEESSFQLYKSVAKKHKSHYHPFDAEGEIEENSLEDKILRANITNPNITTEVANLCLFHNCNNTTISDEELEEIIRLLQLESKAVKETKFYFQTLQQQRAVYKKAESSQPNSHPISVQAPRNTTFTLNITEVESTSNNFD